jgi:hypothetical protein
LSASIPAEKAFIVSLQLRELPFHELRLGGAIVHTGYYPKGGVSVFNLEEDPRFFFPCPFHCLHFYVKRETLQGLRTKLEGIGLTSYRGRTAWLMKPSVTSDPRFFPL